MYGAYLRAVIALPGVVLVAKLIEWIVPFFLPYLPPNSVLYRTFSGLVDNAMLIGLFAVAAGVIAAAAIQSNPRRIR